MKFATMSIICLALLAAACGEDKPSCNSVCNKVGECEGAEAEAECRLMCAQMQEVLRPAVYTAMGDCYLKADCATLQSSGEICILQAMAKADLNAGSEMIGDVCEKMVACEAYADQAACIDDVNENGGSSFDMVGMFKDSVIDCAIGCFESTACGDLEDAMDTCFDQCGLSFGEDGDNNSLDG